ncbi:hypothetical protein niasHS_003553 [Heterodera schachtii]|uniref:Potassium channel domain-containing protein n=2 Tax=Heterodera TaxID=34509 RepID=A0ABD2KI65_HETSC
MREFPRRNVRRETVFIPRYYENDRKNVVDTPDKFYLGESSEESAQNGEPTSELLDTFAPSNRMPQEQFCIGADQSLRRTKKERVLKYTKIIGPHIGLVLLLVVYLLIGATIFHYLEASNEILTRDREIKELFALRDRFHDTIWNLTHSEENVISRESFNGLGQEYFDKLIAHSFSACRNQFTNERHLLNRTHGAEMLWTYANSLFFATTVITTIGYGNLVPMTEFGRIACICFALFGIPLLLVTIADIGKFLSDFLNFLYRTYRTFKTKVRKQSRRFSRYRTASASSHDEERASVSTMTKAGSINLNEINEADVEESETPHELRIPVVMVLFVLLCYCAIGGFLFHNWEGWTYFEAFYFCFITMATVGFGDIVPTHSSTYIILAYIIFGLSLATMCIDLAGTEYIRKIHYLGTKMEDAKGTVITGLKAGEQILKHRGIEVIRTASGKIVQVGGAMLSLRQAQELGVEYILSEFKLDNKHKNILYEPLSPAVQRLIKNKNIKILPGDISDNDGLILQNRSYGKPFLLLQTSPNAIHRYTMPAEDARNAYAILVPFILKETNI